MQEANAPDFTALTAGLLDALAEARSTEAALQQVDRHRRLIAPDSIFSIQQNVTTAGDPDDEIRLRRFYSSEAARYPVNGIKRKTPSPWTECLFLRGRVFVGEGEEALARSFDDFEQMRLHGLRRVVNVPLLQGNLCFATFNVFGTRAHWLPQEVLGIRLLALAAARWVPVHPGLAYRFTGVPLASSAMEA
ncbi:GAF domain-containing protein [Variovorax sp. JS1663]|uniref:GAF domain-containing protein n=1 Tax=Variovorax sp. JS1663 TaxID=1851577 RepID=UPI000B6F4147|nr:GAF domain-containing protein [Variovorax sp. JS1663]OUL98261.1 hypothetical protein A8M77_32505 [Variovorax sp. JS1663]